jgi:hypothetical protein
MDEGDDSFSPKPKEWTPLTLIAFFTLNFGHWSLGVGLVSFPASPLSLFGQFLPHPREPLFPVKENLLCVLSVFTFSFPATNSGLCVNSATLPEPKTKKGAVRLPFSLRGLISYEEIF